MGKVYEFIERQKEGVRRASEKRESRQQVREARRSERETKQYARESQRLARESALEERRAAIREQQAKHAPKGGAARPSGGGVWGGFRSYATGFAQQQQQQRAAPSGLGGFNLGIGTSEQPAVKPIAKRKKIKHRAARAPPAYAPPGYRYVKVRPKRRIARSKPRPAPQQGYW